MSTLNSMRPDCVGLAANILDPTCARCPVFVECQALYIKLTRLCVDAAIASGKVRRVKSKSRGQSKKVNDFLSRLSVEHLKSLLKEEKYERREKINQL